MKFKEEYTVIYKSTEKQYNHFKCLWKNVIIMFLINILFFEILLNQN